MNQYKEEYRKCLRCNETYTEDQAFTIGDTEELCCPFCFDTDYDTVYECEWCGNYYEANELIEYFGICEDCLESLYKDGYFFKFVEKFHLEVDSMETIFEGADFIEDEGEGNQDLKLLYNAIKYLFAQSKLSKEILNDMKQYIFDYYQGEYSEYFVEHLQER